MNTAHDLDTDDNGLDRTGRNSGEQPSRLEAGAGPAQFGTRRFDLEYLAALGATSAVASLLVLTAVSAGPLWRDETNSINLAQMPSLKELWKNLPFESFPPLWLLLLRAWSLAGLAGTDGGIRVLGLFIGLTFLASLWICNRWMGGKAPTLSIALLGSLPAFYFTVGANRAYGLAMCLLVLTFGAIWRFVQYPSRQQLLLVSLCGFIFAHCLYYDLIFFCAMLVPSILVLARRKQWKVVTLLILVGAVICSSMLIYAPIIRQSSAYVRMVQVPFDFRLLWSKLQDAVAAQSSASLAPTGPEIWLWIALCIAGTIAAVLLQRPSPQAVKSDSNSNRAASSRGQMPAADLSLFAAATMVGGTTAYLLFLMRLRFPTQCWYYMGMLSLIAVCLDAQFGATACRLRPWGLMRMALLGLLFCWGGKSVWEEAHTRRTNADLVAAVLSSKAGKGDLIIVQGSWQGIAFDRYYRGEAPWVTLPPIDSHKVHRTDLVWQKLNEPDPVASVLDQISRTLEHSKVVWVVGPVVVVKPEELPAPPPRPPALPTKWWIEPYWRYWGQRVTAHLLGSGAKMTRLVLPLDCPVNVYENLPLLKFEPSESQPAR